MVPERPPCLPGPGPEFPVTPWFAACAPGGTDVRGRGSVGCMTRAQVNAMAEFRLAYLEWQRAVVARCGR